MQVQIVIINSGVVVQHAAPVSLLDDKGTPQPAPSIAVHKESYQELFEYLEGLELFQNCKS